MDESRATSSAKNPRKTPLKVLNQSPRTASASSSSKSKSKRPVDKALDDAWPTHQSDLNMSEKGLPQLGGVLRPTKLPTTRPTSLQKVRSAMSVFNSKPTRELSSPQRIHPTDVRAFHELLIDLYKKNMEIIGMQEVATMDLEAERRLRQNARHALTELKHRIDVWQSFEGWSAAEIHLVEQIRRRIDKIKDLPDQEPRTISDLQLAENLYPLPKGFLDRFLKDQDTELHVTQSIPIVRISGAKPFTKHQ